MDGDKRAKGIIKKRGGNELKNKGLREPNLYVVKMRSEPRYILRVAASFLLRSAG